MTEFALHHTKAKSAGWQIGKRQVIVIGAGRGGSRGDVGNACCRGDRGMQPFSNMFLMNTIFHNFEPFS